MATGYEDWIQYRTRDPDQALTRLGLHIQGLMEIASGARVQADGVQYDPLNIVQLLSQNGFLLNELNRLESVVNRVGMPRMQPTRRVDGGTLVPPDTGIAYGSGA